MRLAPIAKADALQVRDAGEFSGEVAGIGTQRYPPGPRGSGQAAQRTTQQGRDRGTGIVVAGQQLRGQYRVGGPAGHMRATATLSLVVVLHPAFLTSVDFLVGGVDIDRDRALGQHRRPWRGQQREHPLRRPRDTGLHRSPLLRGEPPCQPGRRGRCQARYRCEHLPRLIATVSIQPDQEILPGQLRRGHTHQQLPGTMATVSSLDRPDRAIQVFDQPSRSTSSATAAIPDTGVNVGSGAPIRRLTANPADIA
jgi:hypothetical protein